MDATSPTADRRGARRLVGGAFALAGLGALALGIWVAGSAPPRRASAAPAPPGRERPGRLSVASAERADDATSLFEAAARLPSSGARLERLLAASGRTIPHAIVLRAPARDRQALSALRAGRRAAGRGVELWETAHVLREHRRLLSEGRAPATPRALVRRRVALFARVAGLTSVPTGLGTAIAARAADGEVRLDARAFSASLAGAVEVAGTLLATPRPGAVGSGGRGASGARGADAAAEFWGLWQLALATAGIDALASTLTTDGRAVGAVELRGYDPFVAPRWLPRTLRVVREGGAPAFRVTEAASDLRAQARALHATARYAALTDPLSGPLAPIFEGLRAGSERVAVFRAPDRERAKAVARYLYRNLIALHFDADPKQRSFASVSRRGATGAAVAIGDVGVLLEALAQVAPLLEKDDERKKEVRRLVGYQLAFLTRALPAQGPLPKDLALGGGPKGAAPVQAAGAPSLAELMLGLLAVERRFALGEAKVLLVRVARVLDAVHYDPWAELFLGADPSARTALSPGGQAALLALLAEVGQALDRPAALYRLDRLDRALERLGVFARAGEPARRVEVEVER